MKDPAPKLESEVHGWSISAKQPQTHASDIIFEDSLPAINKYPLRPQHGLSVLSCVSPSKRISKLTLARPSKDLDLNCSVSCL